MARPEKVAVVEEIRTKLADADATVLTEYRGLTVHELADLRGSLRASGTEYKVFKNTLARRAIEGAGYDEITVDVRGAGRDRLRAGRRRRRGQGPARLRPRQPGAGREGRPARRAGHHPGRDRGPRRPAVARGHARPDRGHVPGPAHQGGRPVPGVHPQLRLRREGADRRAGRRRRGRPRGDRGRAPAEETAEPSRRREHRGRAEAPRAEAAAPPRPPQSHRAESAASESTESD